VVFNSRYGRLQVGEGKGGSRGKGKEMTQTLYVYMNKRKKITKKKRKERLQGVFQVAYVPSSKKNNLILSP
jgi:hypothetical protein